ncbi:type II secretion system protein M [Chitiniphilus purpureus]|uniref:Type II secretion system protein M n=1 Tax=Chitiniphilus purpureus TaxID=2981137 RepID=A0ABY6DS48_9NEIS|nr:type II secretion system protein M [Chitiniphilus sp. CD1]UXY17058.1 type II secretion system protein M [Chitiniphilus sp. CD1]
MDRFRLFWRQRTGRERVFLGICGVLLAVALFYLVLWQPAATARERLQRQLPRLEADLAQMQRQITQLKGSRANAGASGDPRSTVQGIVQAAGVQADIRALPDQRVAVDAPDLPFAQALDLLTALRSDSGMRIMKLDIKETGQPGRTSLSIEVQR